MKKFGLILFLSVFTLFLKAANGDTIRIVTHKDTLIKTNPAVGNTSYPATVVFPSTNIKYRKVNLVLTFKCPPSPRRCGEWDYLNRIFVRKFKDSGKIEDIEIQRFITPYGNSFRSGWSYTWTADITDYGFLLHDSTTIVYRHTGYEENNQRSWLIDLHFDLIEGEPILEVVAMDTAYTGRRNYGGTAQLLEKYISSPRTFTKNALTDVAKLKLHFTGHGNDTLDNCGEFCSKNVRCYMNGAKMGNDITMWRDCGSIGLYPQAGTWVIPRANWCPGEMVPVQEFELKNLKNSNTLNLEIDPKANLITKEGDFFIVAHIFQYKNNAKKYDVSIENIISPTTYIEHNRLNPICAQPKVIVKNNGKESIKSLYFKYGVGKNISIYKWKGSISSFQTKEVVLPGYVWPVGSDSIFLVELLYPNDSSDNYPFDNKMTTIVRPTRSYSSKMLFEYRTHRAPQFMQYSLIDQSGNSVYHKSFNQSDSLKNFKDTFDLKEGCYLLRLENNFEQFGFGNGIWFYPLFGSGSASIKNLSGVANTYTFPTDFGRFTQIAFTIGAPEYEKIEDDLPDTSSSIQSSDNTFELEIYPNPAKNYVQITSSEKIEKIIVTDIAGKSLIEKNLKALKQIKIETYNLPTGLYFVQIYTSFGVEIRPFVIEK